MAKSKPATLTSRAGTIVYTGKGAEIKPEDNPAEIPVQTPRIIVRHPEFFFDNTLVAIQIEDTLFNVHKYQLTKSEVFSDMFKIPKLKNDEPEEGSSPENPIVIEGVAASDFAALLKVLYASLFSSHQPSPEALLIIPAFRLANMFNFSELRAHLLPLAEKSLNDVDKIVFAKEFSIKQWLAPAYVCLCQREERLSIEEARKLDVDVAKAWPTTRLTTHDTDEESSTESSEPLERHPEFFFDNTLIAIQIGKTLFNVHKYQLANSQVFSDWLKSPRQGDEPEEGLTPERPIKLKGVSASEFAALLRVLYVSHFSSNQPAPEPPLIIPAFRLAYMLNFSELRTFLLPLAEKNMNDVDKIVFAREFDVKQWLIPAHVHLCRRDKSLNTEEARKLGVDSVLIISRMREQHRSGTQSVNLPFIVGQCYCHVCGGMNHKNSGYSQACSGCNGIHGTAYLRYNGSSLMTTTQSGPTTINGAAIEAGVKKWVEDGCTIKD